MGFLDKLLRRTAAKQPKHAVLVHFEYAKSDLAELRAMLERVIVAAQLGEFDGNEVATDGAHGTLYMYGPSADALFTAVRPTLEAAAFMKGARVVLRYGPPGVDVAQTTVTLPVPR